MEGIRARFSLAMDSEISRSGGAEEGFDFDKADELTKQMCNFLESYPFEAKSIRFDFNAGSVSIHCDKKTNPEIWEWYKAMIEHKFIIDNVWSSNNRSSVFNRYSGNRIGKDIHAIVTITRPGFVFSSIDITIVFCGF